MRKDVLWAALAGVIVLGLVNLSILKKEALLKEGEVFFLELAPVDPRSLMQGDYMALRFKIAGDLYDELSELSGDNGSGERDLSVKEGRIVVSLDENRVARFARLHENESLEENERLMRFHVSDNRVKFATDAFFFREGTGEAYERARYGEFRVDENGESVLIGLCDEDLNKLEPAATDGVRRSGARP